MRRYEWKGNEILYLKLFRKKLQDMKLKTKITVFLFFVTFSTCMIIGVWSFRISKKAVIHNSETMAINLMKQVGLNLDERIDSFSDISYRILQISSINTLIKYSKVEAEQNKRNSGNEFNKAILQQSSLYSYTKFALLRSNNKVITEYYKAREKKKSEKEEIKILNQLQKYVNIQNPTNWIKYNGELYFVRKIIDSNSNEEGILCFAMSDKFLRFIGTDQDYLTNENIIILNNESIILKNEMSELSDEQIRVISNYNNGSYYVYTCEKKIKENKYSVVALNTISNNWILISFMPYSALLMEVYHIFETIFIVTFSVLILAIIITGFISTTITQNVKIIEQGMKNFEAGNFDMKIKPVSYDEIGLLALQFNYMGLKIKSLITLLEEEEAAKRESEFQTLQAQINPHFLYNTLGSLKWAAYRKQEFETVEAIDSLINLLRFTIKKAGKLIPVKEEIEYIKNYIAIEKMRYGNVFQIYYELQNEVKDYLMPGFVLQPFVENALVHGLDMSNNNSEIIIRAYFDKHFLILEIDDNGIGMTEEKINEVLNDTQCNENKKYNGFNSIGIKIVDVRMRSFYGDQYQTVIRSREGQGTLVKLYIPYMEGMQYEMQNSDCGR
jgi:Predicted signal transduction protein with a C-terminal ATPase domain